MGKVIYLDHAAATPIDQTVLTAMQPYFSEKFYNPSATYLPAQVVAKDLQTARERVAHTLGVKPAEIIFTAGGTEANNLAIHGVMRRFPEATMITSAIEHESVLRPADLYKNHICPVDKNGLIRLDKLERLITDKTVLVSIMYANNEIGTIEPLSKVAQLIKQVRQARQKKSSALPLYFHTDACQAAAYLDLHVSRLGVDMLTLNAGKIYGPKQAGVLFVRGGVDLEPLILGGGQERGLRSGTENVAAAVGLTTALELTQSKRSKEVGRLQALQKGFFAQLAQKIPGAVINGSQTHRLPNNLHITLPGHDNERLLIELEQKGILAAAGSACSASSEKPSHVLRAIGLKDAAAQASLRLTMGQGTTKQDMSRVIDCLAQLVA